MNVGDRVVSVMHWEDRTDRVGLESRVIDTTPGDGVIVETPEGVRGSGWWEPLEWWPEGVHSRPAGELVGPLILACADAWPEQIGTVDLGRYGRDPGRRYVGAITPARALEGCYLGSWAYQDGAPVYHVYLVDVLDTEPPGTYACWGTIRDDGQRRASRVTTGRASEEIGRHPAVYSVAERSA